MATGGDDVPVVWVDRAGAKIGFHETHSRSSKANYGLVIEEVTTRDEQGQIVTSGRKMLPSGNAAQDGPPTTHSSKGKDRVAFLQGNVTRDATHYVNGTPVGARDQFTVSLSCSQLLHSCVLVSVCVEECLTVTFLFITVPCGFGPLRR